MEVENVVRNTSGTCDKNYDCIIYKDRKPSFTVSKKKKKRKKYNA